MFRLRSPCAHIIHHSCDFQRHLIHIYSIYNPKNIQTIPKSFKELHGNIALNTVGQLVQIASALNRCPPPYLWRSPGFCKGMMKLMESIVRLAAGPVSRWDLNFRRVAGQYDLSFRNHSPIPSYVWELRMPTFQTWFWQDTQLLREHQASFHCRNLDQLCWLAQSQMIRAAASKPTPSWRLLCRSSFSRNVRYSMKVSEPQKWDLPRNSPMYKKSLSSWPHSPAKGNLECWQNCLWFSKIAF